MSNKVKVTLDPLNIGSGITLSNENLTAVIPSLSSTTRATLGRDSGKWYWEVSFSSLTYSQVGISNDLAGVGNTHLSTNARRYSSGGNKIPENIKFGTSYTKDDVVGVLLDLDNGILKFYKNGISQGISHTNIKPLGLVYPSITSGSSSGGCTSTINFGATPFKYLPTDLPIGTHSYDGNITTVNFFLLQSNSRLYSTKYKDSFEPLSITSYTTPSPYQITSSGDFSSDYACWKAFDGKNATYSDSWITTSGAPLGWIQVNFGTSKVFNQLSFTTRNHTDSNTTAPKEFKILGSFDGVSWTELTLIQNQTGWKQNETRIFEFNNSIGFQYYRVQITVANSTSYSAIGELIFGYKGVSLLNIPSKSASNFIHYGQVTKLEGLDKIIDVVSYVLQDTKLNNTTIKQIDKKPLGISFY
ncbi:discoidin domain-containing protein [Lysinibacillus fusiformis]|uniref:discoidin domain-containing protein n=1 Tax=Lysinibacillus fusiformis TaxID=28031 RepID=UPI0020BFBCD4|nr:discoidin domain-containing protein [Lysinibacillus fusiformis]